MSLQIYDYYLNGARKMGENCEKQYIFKAFALTGRIADCECTQGAALSYELLGFQPVSTVLLEINSPSPFGGFIDDRCLLAPCKYYRCCL